MPTAVEGDQCEFTELVGRRVERIVLKGLIEVCFDGDDGARFQIESPLSIADDAGHTAVVCYQPALSQPPVGLDRLARLHNAQVQRAMASAAGDLELAALTQHGEQLTLTVPADRYEAWNFHGPGTLIVSMAGGGIAWFPATDPPAEADHA